MPDIDDVNDACWLVIHTADDIVGRASSRDVLITSEERRSLYEKAKLFTMVYERYTARAQQWR